VDGCFIQLDPTFHDLVIVNDTAATAYERFKKGDSLLPNAPRAADHVHG